MNAEPTIMVEFTIQDGKDTIFGVLCRPADEKRHPAIIISHGYNASCSYFEDYCRYYAQHGIVAYVYDFCGGSADSRSSGKTTDMTLFTERDNLLAVYQAISGLDCVDPRKIFLLGESQGGMVTALCTELLQEKVRAMILYYPAFCIPEDWRRRFPKEEDIPETMEFWGMTLGKAYFTSMRNMRVFDEIGTYQGEVLILYGEKDLVVPIESMYQAENAYRQARLVVLRQEGHGFSDQGSAFAKKQVLNLVLRESEESGKTDGKGTCF